ncbi:glycerate kinase [Propionibacterium sp.]|uniref:glycerate kinase n=1 Tax=Propionibacterium sp. TaxID=1977903 RepID=UPI0039E74DAD
MNTFVLAPDSFKESLRAVQAARAMELGVHDADSSAQTLMVPMADGGEGFAEVLAQALGARRIEVDVHDALGRPITGALHLREQTAVIDVATAVGLGLIDPADRDIMVSDSTGVGELVLAALDAGATELIVGLGGSATNDGGAGMLRALGARFFDSAGRELTGQPAELSAVASVDAGGLDSRLETLRVQAACDVRSPLLGGQGASAVFGPQKGATPQLVGQLDSMLGRLSQITGDRGNQMAAAPGSGAAGGLGWAFMTFLGAQMRPGVEVVIDATGLREKLAGATALLTGEGSVDAQTATGKTVAGLAGIAQEAKVPVAVFAGQVHEDASALYEIGVTRLVQITPEGTPLDKALGEAGSFLRDAVAQLVRDGGWASRC